MKYLILALSLFAAPAFAADAPPPPEARTIDMTIILRTDRGEAMKDVFDRDPGDEKCLKCDDLTLGRAIYRALTWSFDDERQLGWEQRFARGMLANRIKADKAAALTASEVAAIEKVLGKLFGGGVLTQAIPLIDPNVKPAAVQ